jgi:hypothetical protein
MNHRCISAQPFLAACTAAFAIFVVGCASSASPPEIFPGLINVKRIYIANLGNEDGAGLVREKIRLGLVRSQRFEVVEVPDDADAILTGVAGVERRYTGSQGNLQTHYSGLGVLRIVELKTRQTIWTFEYKRGFGGPLSVSSRVANQLVNKLLTDAANAAGTGSLK